MKIIVTGGCGFIGHHFVEHIYKNTDWEIIIIDKLSYASFGFERIKDLNILNDSRLKIFTFDLTNEIPVGIKYEIGKNVDFIVHLAAETHVDNSIEKPREIIYNNVMSTVNLLEFSKELPNLKKFFYFSTDEVFGPAMDDILYKEWDRHRPTNPYSASKSASENICISYENTYKLPIIIINVMNAFGERQYVEKFIPNTIKKILNNETIYIHANEDKTKSGTRFYIHARNIANAVLFLIKHGQIGEKYNISGEKEVSNLDMAKFIANILGKKLKYEMVDYHSKRPGHDLRYGLDGQKLKKMGWTNPINFDESLKKTIIWTINNKKWLDF